MKKGFLILISISLIFFTSSCRSTHRDYQEDELANLALSDYGFDLFSVFKIIDIETSNMLTGKTYQNSGVVIGTIKGKYKLLFVPRKVVEVPFFVGEEIYFDLKEIYTHLQLKNVDQMFLQDYGSLSITVMPYSKILEANPKVVFDSRLFFVVTTDSEVFYCNYAKKSLLIFDVNFKLIE